MAFQIQKIARPPTPFNLQLVTPIDVTAFPTEAGRFYKTPAGFFPSVTTVLGTLSKEGIDAWIERVGETAANRKKNKAANRGSQLHALCEKYLTDSAIDLAKERPGTIKLFRQIQPELDAHITKILGIEIGLYSDILRTAGRTDILAECDRIPSIVDFKTSSKKKLEKYLTSYFYQATAYSIMVRELYGIECEQLVLVFGLTDSDKPDVVRKRLSDYEPTVREFYRNHTLTLPEGFDTTNI